MNEILNVHQMHTLYTVHCIGSYGSSMCCSLQSVSFQNAESLSLTVLRVAIDQMFMPPQNVYTETLISSLVECEGELMRDLGKLMRLHS